MNTPSLPLSCSSALLRFAVQVIVIIHLASDQPLLSTAASSLVCSLLMGLFSPLISYGLATLRYVRGQLFSVSLAWLFVCFGRSWISRHRDFHCDFY